MCGTPACLCGCSLGRPQTSHFSCLANNWGSKGQFYSLFVVFLFISNDTLVWDTEYPLVWKHSQWWCLFATIFYWLCIVLTILKGMVGYSCTTGNRRPVSPGGLQCVLGEHRDRKKDYFAHSVLLQASCFWIYKTTQGVWESACYGNGSIPNNLQFEYLLILRPRVKHLTFQFPYL